MIEHKHYLLLDLHNFSGMPWLGFLCLFQIYAQIYFLSINLKVRDNLGSSVKQSDEKKNRQIINKNNQKIRIQDSNSKTFVINEVWSKSAYKE